MKKKTGFIHKLCFIIVITIISIIDFFTDTEWTPLFTNKRYGILPLLSGTLLTSFIAIAVLLLLAALVYTVVNYKI